MVSLNRNRRARSEAVRLSAGVIAVNVIGASATGRHCVIGVGSAAFVGNVTFVVVHHRRGEKFCTGIAPCWFVVLIALHGTEKRRGYRHQSFYL